MRANKRITGTTISGALNAPAADLGGVLVGVRLVVVVVLAGFIPLPVSPSCCSAPPPPLWEELECEASVGGGNVVVILGKAEIRCRIFFFC